MEPKRLRKRSNHDVFTWIRGQRCPVWEFLRGLEKPAHNQALAMLRRVATSGLPQGEERKRHLRGDIWELKPGDVRLLYFTDSQERIVVTNGFLKKDQKTRSEQIDRAEELRAEWRMKCE